MCNNGITIQERENGQRRGLSLTQGIPYLPVHHVLYISTLNGYFRRRKSVVDDKRTPKYHLSRPRITQCDSYIIIYTHVSYITTYLLRVRKSISA